MRVCVAREPVAPVRRKWCDAQYGIRPRVLECRRTICRVVTFEAWPNRATHRCPGCGEDGSPIPGGES